MIRKQKKRDTNFKTKNQRWDNTIDFYLQNMPKGLKKEY